MIEHTTVDGRPATVTYLKTGFKPGTKEDHDFAKILWDDGRMAFVYKQRAR